MGLFNWFKPKEVIRNSEGSWWFDVLNGKSHYEKLTEEQRMRYMLTNPALAKVISMNCDIFSLGKIKRVDGESDAFTEFLKRPNKFQTLRQFLWSYRFYTMYGNAFLKHNSSIVNSPNNQIYILDSSKVEFDNGLGDVLDKMIYSSASFKDLQRQTITYTYNDGSQKDIPLGELLVFSDLSNNTGNWYKGASRIDALYKVLSNNEKLLNAKGINLDFVGKFLVSGTFDPAKDLGSFAGMQNIEKEDIQRKIMGSDAVTPIKASVDIRRFVDDLAKLRLDESYVNDLLVIGDMFSIPKELIGALIEGSTYENQEKALSRHISYSEMPKAQDLLEGITNHFGLNPDDYEMTWDELPFMQEDENVRSEVNERNIRTLREMLSLGVNMDDAKEFLGLPELNIDYNEEEETITDDSRAEEEIRSEDEGGDSPEESEGGSN